MVNKSNVIPYTSIYQQVGSKRKSRSRQHKKASSRKKTKRELPPALVEYRKLSDKILKAIFALPNLPSEIKDGAPMKKLIGKLLRENNRNVSKIIDLLNNKFIISEYDKAKREIEQNRMNKKSNSSSD